MKQHFWCCNFTELIFLFLNFADTSFAVYFAFLILLHQQKMAGLSLSFEDIYHKL